MTPHGRTDEVLAFQEHRKLGDAGVLPANSDAYRESDGPARGAVQMPHPALPSSDATWSTSRGPNSSRSPRLPLISESFPRNYVRQANIDEDRSEGLTTGERAEFARLRRERRVNEMEIEILKRASALFAGESVLPQ